MERKRYTMIFIRKPTQEVFLTMYTMQLDQKMRRLIRKAVRGRLNQYVSDQLKDLPPVTKGEMLLAKWEDEQGDFDPATDRADEADYCPRCGYICCECD